MAGAATCDPQLPRRPEGVPYPKSELLCLRRTPKRPLLGAHFERQDNGKRNGEPDGKSDGYSRKLGRQPAAGERDVAY